MARAARRERPDERVHVGPSPDVNSTRDVGQQQDLTPDFQQLADEDLLLVAAAERPTSCSRLVARMLNRSAISRAAACSLPRKSSSRENRSRIGSVRFSRIDRAIIRPSVRRSSGTSATPLRRASFGERNRTGSPLSLTSPRGWFHP